MNWEKQGSVLSDTKFRLLRLRSIYSESALHNTIMPDAYFAFHVHGFRI